MNPIQSYFEWHDAKYLKQAENPDKNRSATKMFRTLRVFTLVVTALAGAFLVAVTAVILSEPGSLPEYWVPVLAVLFGYGVLLYT